MIQWSKREGVFRDTLTTLLPHPMPSLQPNNKKDHFIPSHPPTKQNPVLSYSFNQTPNSNHHIPSQKNKTILSISLHPTNQTLLNISFRLLSQILRRRTLRKHKRVIYNFTITFQDQARKGLKIMKSSTDVQLIC